MIKLSLNNHTALVSNKSEYELTLLQKTRISDTVFGLVRQMTENGMTDEDAYNSLNLYINQNFSENQREQARLEAVSATNNTSQINIFEPLINGAEAVFDGAELVLGPIIQPGYLDSMHQNQRLLYEKLNQMGWN